jgi:hypothetical protein
VSRPEFSFSFHSANDLLGALKEDLSDLEANHNSSRHAIHCAFLGWHMHEWVWATKFKGDAGAQRRVFGCEFTKLKDFALRIRQNCVDLEVMQGVAEGSKHLGTNAAVTGTVDNLYNAIPGCATFGQMILGSPGVLGVQLDDGSMVEFLPAIRTVIEYWELIITA